jgi:hypothetical protein
MSVAAVLLLTAQRRCGQELRTVCSVAGCCCRSSRMVQCRRGVEVYRTGGTGTWCPEMPSNLKVQAATRLPRSTRVLSMPRGPSALLLHRGWPC